MFHIALHASDLEVCAACLFVEFIVCVTVNTVGVLCFTLPCIPQTSSSVQPASLLNSLCASLSILCVNTVCQYCVSIPCVNTVCQ